MGILNDPNLEALIDKLHLESIAQKAEIDAYFSKRAAEGSLSWKGFDDDANRFLSDKLVALEKDKAEYCYLLCRALGAKRIVEAGTSCGVSTPYLAAAIRDNGGGVVIATENDPAKYRGAKDDFAAAGLSSFIELREGDLRDSLRVVDAPVDFMLVDIWTPMARPALELIAPRLRPGAVVLCDNTAQFPEVYSEYFAFLADPANRFRTTTLPFEGGLEMSLRY